MGWKCKTKRGGYNLSEVISALQKCIRRGDEQQAMYWALEAIPEYEAYVWRRLNVIVQEDIGIANPQLLLLVPSQEQVYFRFRERRADGSARLVLANTILAMCRSTKSRIADHFQCAVHQGMLHNELHYDVPDYALDKHTDRGRSLRRGLSHWREEGCQLVNKDPQIEDPYEDTAFRYWESFVRSDWSRDKGKRTDREQEPELPGEEQLSMF
jgi:replication-associated recombination protein RarA